MEKPKKRKIDAVLVQKLNSDNPQKALSALKELRAVGHCDYMPELLRILNETKSDEIKKELALFLSDIRDKGCIPYIIESLNNDQFQRVKNILVAACWQSRLDYSSHIDTFIDLFIKEDYLTSLEAFTVIEESLVVVPVDKISQYRERLISSIEDIDDDKKPLLRELINLMVA